MADIAKSKTKVDDEQNGDGDKRAVNERSFPSHADVDFQFATPSVVRLLFLAKKRNRKRILRLIGRPPASERLQHPG